MKKRTIHVGDLLRENAFVLEKTRRRYLRVSREAEQTVIHRFRDLLLPGLAQFAAERAAKRGSRTVQLVDVQDYFDIRGH